MSTDHAPGVPNVEEPSPPGATPGQDPSTLPPAKGMSALMLIAGIVACTGAAVTIGFVSAGHAAREQGGRPVPRTTATITSASIAGGASATVPARAGWSSARQARWVSNHPRSMAVEVDAARSVTVWMKQVRPTLVVRCLQKRVDVFVYTDSAARIEPQDENHTVSVALDAGVASSERWPDSAEHDALFAPDGADFARRLAGAQRLRFGFTPHNAQPVVASFDLQGAAEAIVPVLQRCGG